MDDNPHPPAHLGPPQPSAHHVRNVAPAAAAIDDDPCDPTTVAAAVQATMESEDSSYDSDYENSESLSPCCCHSDVSRTVSDTLGAEYSDWLTDSLLSDPGYNRCVEFGLKLGYTEVQVQQALQKLGPKAGTNDLLAELIRLGTGADQVSSVQQASGGQGAASSGAAQAAALQAQSIEAGEEEIETTQLRHIVIDGSNVAMSHGNKEYFSCRGIRLCVDWFQGRGHREITVFVPKWRKEASRPDAPIQDQDILLQLEKDRLLVFTPSRHVAGRRMVCYDDRYILKLASDVEGIVVSNDNYRDLISENPEYRKVVEERLLMYSFVNDRFMPPEDPLGRHGPSLDQFLRRPVSSGPTSHLLQPPCPYGKKCTYGNKCKYRHPERGNLPQKSVTERLVEQAKIQLQEVKSRNLKQQGSRDSSPGEKIRGPMPLHATTSCDLSGFHKNPKKLPLSRTQSLVTTSTFAPMEPFDLDGRRIPGMASIPAPHQYPSASSSATQGWTNVSLNLLQNIPPPHAEMFLEPDGGGHLSVAKRLSDPESAKPPPPPSSFSRLAVGTQPGFSGTSSNPNIAASNLHKKLQRQLTLNPTFDPRLCNIHGCVGDGSPASLKKKKAASQEHIPEPVRAHVPVTRLDSDPRSLQCQHLTVQHPNVMRISSAPDSSRQFSPTEPIQKLNSTSDTRLNVGTLAGHRYPYLAVPQSSWFGHDVPTSPLKPHVVRPASVPPHSMMGSPLGTPRAMSPDPYIIDDPRRRLFFHLASIFPEEHVQRAMDMYPEESNPQKLCAIILHLFPK